MWKLSVNMCLVFCYSHAATEVIARYNSSQLNSSLPTVCWSRSEAGCPESLMLSIPPVWSDSEIKVL